MKKIFYNIKWIIELRSQNSGSHDVNRFVFTEVEINNSWGRERERERLRLPLLSINIYRYEEDYSPSGIFTTMCFFLLLLLYFIYFLFRGRFLRQEFYGCLNLFCKALTAGELLYKCKSFIVPADSK